MEEQINSMGESQSAARLAEAGNDFLKNAGQSASSYLLAGSTGTNQGTKSMRILSLLSGGMGVSGSSTSAATVGKKLSEMSASAAKTTANSKLGQKAQTLFEKFKSSKFMNKLGSVLGKLQIKGPIHLIDSLITYLIGVISGMQDMAQVRFCHQYMVLLCYLCHH